MPITGAWANRQAFHAGARKWGTGWNPVHATRDGQGRNIAPTGTTVLVPSELVTADLEPDYGYCAEDVASTLYGYGTETGTADRPRYDPDGAQSDRTATPPGFPPYTHNGESYRAKRHGPGVTASYKQVPFETVSEGWRNKAKGDVEDAVTSDPSQYVVQTSMVQGDQTRTGSQTPGRANAPRASIRTRLVGQKLRYWSGEQRHYDMTPRVQDQIIRPWWGRNFGTGDPADMAPNEMYVSEPMVRTPPPNPYTGDVIDDTPVISDGGYVGEDDLPYV